MKLSFCCVLLFGCQMIFSQYNYGLIVEDHDAQIEGKLNLNAVGNSIFIGSNVGLNDNGMENRNTFVGYLSGQDNISGDQNVFMGSSSGRLNIDGHSNVFVGSDSGNSNLSGFANVFLGNDSGKQNESGNNNVFIGHDTGMTNLGGSGNVYIGSDTGNLNLNGGSNVMLGTSAGFYSRTGERNTYLGYQAGLNNETGRGNIFIGYKAGANELGQFKLYIDNSDTATPLIYGDFLEDNVTINGTLFITETAKLQPMAQPSMCNTSNEVGLMYFDRAEDRVFVCTRGGGWQPMN